MRPVSPAVYRRRRLVFFGAVILAVVAVALGIWLAVAQPWGARQTPSPTSSATAGPTGSAAPSPSTSPTTDASAETDEGAGADESTDENADGAQGTKPAVAPCRGADLKIEALTDSDSYPAGALPALSISLTNEGSAPCTLDVGSATQRFTVTSGTDVWWRSTDCQESPSNMVVTLDAGQNVTSAEPVTWDRTRSDVSTCADENRSRAPAGGASYHVGVSIGGFESLDTRQIMLY